MIYHFNYYTVGISVTIYLVFYFFLLSNPIPFLSLPTLSSLTHPTPNYITLVLPAGRGELTFLTNPLISGKTSSSPDQNSSIDKFTKPNTCIFMFTASCPFDLATCHMEING